MSVPRVLKAILRVSPTLLVAASGCAVGYGAPRADGPPPPSIAGHPDMTGWRLLGQTEITGVFEHAIIPVGKYEGRVARVMLVITESSVEAANVVIQFGNGQRWSPGLRHSFGDGSRSRAIDLPGHVRFIRAAELVHGSVPPGAHARVEVWGQ